MKDSGRSAIEKIKDLIKEQYFLVLCTSGDKKAYGSLVAYSFTEDFKNIYFATSRQTKKYRLLREHPRVAAVIDNRSSTEDFQDLDALTITAKACQIDTDDKGFSRGFRALKERHPYLGDFLKERSTVLFCLEEISIFLVLDLNTVFDWRP